MKTYIEFFKGLNWAEKIATTLITLTAISGLLLFIYNAITIGLKDF
jgi:hypothetical protein